MMPLRALRDFQHDINFKSDNMNPSDTEQSAALIRDLIDAQRDLVALGQAHDLSLGELADWVRDEANRACLSGLCTLADLQAQLVVSRFRLLAASRLLTLATREGESASAEDVSRKACVDLLKLDLKRAGDAAPTGKEGDETPDPAAALAALLDDKSEGAM